MRQAKTLLAAFLVVLMLISAFTACSAVRSETALADAASDGPSENEGVIINFLCVNENYTQAMRDCIARWEEKTGNKVNVQLYPASAYITVLSTQMMAGGTVDLFRSDGVKNAERKWSLEYFYDLSNEPWVSRLADGVQDMIASSDGTIRGIPYMTNAYFGMMYNKRIFEQAGITQLPATWDEFLDACEKIKTNTEAIPVNISAANGSEFCATHLMHGLINNVYTTRSVAGAKKLFEDLNTNKVHYADVPEYKAALEQIVELRDKGYITEDFITSTYEMAVERFGTGAVAMYPCADYILEPLLCAYSEIEDDIGFFPTPYQDTKGTLAICTGVGLHVASNAPHLEEALDFMDYYASQENQILFNEATPGLNLFSDVPVSNNVITQYYSDYADVSFTALDETGVVTWPEIETRRIIQDLLLGEVTPEGMLEKIDQAAAVIGKKLGIEGW